MIVAELIEHLKKFPQDALVVQFGHEDGYDDIDDEPTIVRLGLNTSSGGMYGKHDDKDKIDYFIKHLDNQERYEEALKYKNIKLVDAVLIN